MSSVSPRRRRTGRGATLELPPGPVARLFFYIRRAEVLLRIALCVVAALAMWAFTGAWTPPFVYHTGYTPPRNIVARVDFDEVDYDATKEARQKARRDVICIYTNDPGELKQRESALRNEVFRVIRAASFADLDKEAWNSFYDEPAPGQLPITEQQRQLDFEKFAAAFQADPELTEFEKTLSRAMAEFEKKGLLKNIEHSLNEGSQTHIYVQSPGEELPILVSIDDVRIELAPARLETRLKKEFPTKEVAERLFTWLKTRLIKTLSFDEKARAATERAAELAEQNVAPVMIHYGKGRETLAAGGEPLADKELRLLRMEHAAFVSAMSLTQQVRYSLADLGMFVALYTLCGVYIYFRERRLLLEFRRLATMLVLVVATILVAWLASRDQWRAEMIPIVFFGLTVTIAYQRELALLLSAAVGLAVVLSLGQDLAAFVILIATVSAAVLLLGRIRSRTKLIYVGLWAGMVGLFTTLGVSTLAGQPFAQPLWSQALWYGFCAAMAGLVMTGLLPFIEKLFDVQTEISLLELGDAAHPLLQELVRRAPGTYNHSINVASIAEAAAEAIGANGLLVRVGAYFHDIGKMLKPGYYIENQGQEANRHESLLPAMSTLVIIAHVKDGADLARQHHLPNSIIDFILQHHGTTLVEYFYRRASEQSKENPDGQEVEEHNFRYPGPKPQTRETGVLMLADAVESASRTLVEPTPARIENVVHELVQKRLLDGQFDECGLTLQELRTIEDSLVKSLTAVYHGRVKYPSQQTA